MLRISTAAKPVLLTTTSPALLRQSAAGKKTYFRSCTNCDSVDWVAVKLSNVSGRGFYVCGMSGVVYKISNTDDAISMWLYGNAALSAEGREKLWQRFGKPAQEHEDNDGATRYIVWKHIATRNL